MPAGVDEIYRSLRFDSDEVNFSKWPKLSCSAANELTLATPPTEDDPDPGAARLAIAGELKLQAGVAVNELSSDEKLTNNSDLAIPTQKAVKTYIDTQISQVNSALSIKAALAGSAAQDFRAKKLTVSESLTTSNLKTGHILAFQSSGSYSAMATFESKNPEPPYVNWLHNKSGGDTVRYGYIQAGDWGSSKQFRLVAENGANFTFINGNIGIGTEIPKSKLDVAGDLRADAIQSSTGFKFPDGTVQTTAIRIVSGIVGFEQQSGVVTNRKTVQLSGFHQNLTCFVAPATIDAANNANLRIRTYVENVTKNSFDICLTSWADTKIYWAQVGWIAFGS